MRIAAELIDSFAHEGFIAGAEHVRIDIEEDLGNRLREKLEAKGFEAIRRNKLVRPLPALSPTSPSPGPSLEEPVLSWALLLLREAYAGHADGRIYPELVSGDPSALEALYDPWLSPVVMEGDRLLALAAVQRE